MKKLVKVNILIRVSSQLCDFAIGSITSNQSRFPWMDFLHGNLEWAAVLIIPKPQPVKDNIAAIIKPFQPWVCLTIFKV